MMSALGGHILLVLSLSHSKVRMKRPCCLTRGLEWTYHVFDVEGEKTSAVVAQEQTVGTGPSSPRIQD